MQALRTSLRMPAARAGQRGLATSASRMSSNSHMVDPDKAAEELEAGKQQNLKGETDTLLPHAPGWNEKIASESEAIIKAAGTSKGPQELQKETVTRLTEKSDAGATVTKETAKKTTVKQST